MFLYRLSGLLFVAAIVLAGCSTGVLESTADKIANARKAGNPEQAKEIAVTALREKPNNMDVWRELAATDLELARAAADHQKDATAELVEAALICAAVHKHTQTNPDKEWKSVGNLACIFVGNQAGHLLRKVEPQSRDWKWTPDDSLIHRPDEMDEVERHIFQRHKDNEQLVDGELLGKIAPKATILITLLKSLPAENFETLTATWKQLDKQLSNSLDHADASGSIIASEIELAERETTSALKQAVDELDSTGHFAEATILENNLLE